MISGGLATFSRRRGRGSQTLQRASARTGGPSGRLRHNRAVSAPVVEDPVRDVDPSVTVRARPAWGQVTLGVVLVAAAVLYSWELDRQGWANSYYAAAAQAGASGWKAFLFGSVDPGNALATDKPPLSLWVMSASVRMFGLSTWSLLVPQVVMSVASVFVLHRTVRRQAGPVAALVAAVALATTPVFVVLARYDDPDTLLTLLSLLAAYASVRAGERSRRWAAMAGVCLGAAFLTKFLAGLLVAPALMIGFAHLPSGLRRARIAVATTAATVTGTWWVVQVWLTPASERPYIDGSHANSVLDVALGRDGLSRMTGPMHVSAPVLHNPVAGLPGPWRLLGPQFAGQVSWLLPLAALAAVAGLLLTRGARSRQPRRTAYLVWTVWLATTAAIFSFMNGPVHPYYSVVMAPAIAALSGMGVAEVWSRRHRPSALTTLVALGALALTCGWSLVLLQRPAQVGAAVWVSGLVATAGLLALVALPLAPGRARAQALAVVSALLVMFAGPLVFAAATDGRTVTGANPVAGPGPSGSVGVVDPVLVQFLRTHHGDQRWAAAVPTATAASRLQLDSGQPVLPLGGFLGSVASPTLQQVQQWVASGRLRFVVLAGPYRRLGPEGTPKGLVGTQTAQIITWARQVGRRVPLPPNVPAVYDLRG